MLRTLAGNRLRKKCCPGLKLRRSLRNWLGRKMGFCFDYLGSEVVLGGDGKYKNLSITLNHFYNMFFQSTSKNSCDDTQRETWKLFKQQKEQSRKLNTDLADVTSRYGLELRG